MQDEEFIERWDPFLSSNKWGRFLSDWVNALEGGGTPASFLDTFQWSHQRVEFHGEEYRFFTSDSSNHNKRRELMKKQPPYVASQHHSDLKVGECHLCGEIARHRDGDSARVLLENEHYIILPNLYPAFPGATLAVPKAHDCMENRVSRLEDGRYKIQPGELLAKELSEDELLSLFKVCDEMKLILFRNAPLDAMSIPEHDHCHLLPEDLPTAQMAHEMLRSRYNIRENDARFSRSTATPFDTLLISANSKQELTELTCQILSSLNRDQIVYTLGYCKGNVLVTPRKFSSDSIQEQISLGGGIPLHAVSSRPGLIQDARERIHARGEMNWDDYIPSKKFKKTA